jgi:hypothetical protein
MNEPTTALLDDAHSTVREQLAAAWQLHIDRIQEVVAAKWPTDIERIFSEAMSTLAARLEAQHSQRTAESRTTAQRELSEKLNQSARRLRDFETNWKWGNTLVESTQGFCDRAALFTIETGELRLESARNLTSGIAVENVPVTSAPAFANAVESKDTVIAMRTKGEMSDPIASLLGEAEGRKFYLFPVVMRERVVAILYADAEDRPVDSSALDLLATVAGAVLESRNAVHERSTLVNIAGGDSGNKPEVSSWFSLSREDQELHLKAQRFARVHIAGIRLHKSEKVKEGRTRHALYASLKTEIDSGREVFMRDFLPVSPTMVDYLHLELLRTLANDNGELLGSDYPGPMV